MQTARSLISRLDWILTLATSELYFWLHYCDDEELSLMGQAVLLLKAAWHTRDKGFASSVRKWYNSINFIFLILSSKYSNWASNLLAYHQFRHTRNSAMCPTLDGGRCATRGSEIWENTQRKGFPWPLPDPLKLYFGKEKVPQLTSAFLFLL